MTAVDCSKGFRPTKAARRRVLAAACAGADALAASGAPFRFAEVDGAQPGRWHALRVVSGQETLACWLLAERGVSAVAPLKAVDVRVSRRRAGRRRVLRAGLPGYVFAQLPVTAAGEDADGFARFEVEGWCWPAIDAVRPVLGVVGIGGVPRGIAAEDVARLMAQSADVNEALRAARAARLSPGCAARVTGGPFEGLVVEVSGVRGLAAQVLLPMFGATRAAEVDAAFLDVA